MYVYVLFFFLLALSAKRAVVTMNTLCSQILVSKNHSSLKGPRDP